MMHFDEMTGLLYLEGQLDATHAQHVAAHVETCAECRELLRALESEGVWLRESLTQDDESIPARVMESLSTARPPWGWIATLAFGGAGAYTLWSTIIQPWSAQAAQAGFTQGNLLTMLFFSSAFWKGWDAMRSLMESSAVAILVMAVIWLLRRYLRRATTLAVVMTAALCMMALGLAPSASASQTEHGNPNYTLPSDQEVKTDLIVFGDSIRIEGTVDGDLIAWSQYVIVNGHVKGDVLAFGQEIRINGTVDGNVRTWSQLLSISGAVGRNVTSWSETTEVLEKGSVGGSLTAGLAKMDLEGKIQGDMLVGGANLSVNGLAGRDIQYRGDSLSIGPRGEVTGRIRYRGYKEAEIAQGAKLANQVEFTPLKRGPNYTQARYYWHRLLLWGASFVFGIVLLLLAPVFFLDAANACNRFGLTSGLGILFLIATPIVAVLACCTIVGIGLGIATVLMYVIALYAAQVFVGCWLGEKLLGPSHGAPSAIGRMALGLVILRALGMLPYWIGAMVTSVVLVCGLGAIVLTVYKNLRGVPVEAQA